MDKFDVILSPKAAKDIDGFSDAACSKIVHALKTLAENPFPKGKLIRKLKGKNTGFYRLRADKCRVFYIIEKGKVVVLRVLSKKDTERYIRNLS